MMHSPEHARAWMAPHNQPTLGRVVPAIGVSAPATGQPFKKKLAPLTQIPQDHQGHAANAAHRQSHSFRTGSPFVN
jgi:hypothetical protein